MFWVFLSAYLFLTIFAGIMSGLTMGLLSLDKTQLEILQKVGKPEERKYAKRLFPIGRWWQVIESVISLSGYPHGAFLCDGIFFVLLNLYGKFFHVLKFNTFSDPFRNLLAGSYFSFIITHTQTIFVVKFVLFLDPLNPAIYADFPSELSSSLLFPTVKRHHLLLVTLLLSNAGAVEAMPIFMDRITNPVAAVAISVTAVLFFGEIIPQALCTRYG